MSGSCIPGMFGIYMFGSPTIFGSNSTESPAGAGSPSLLGSCIFGGVSFVFGSSTLSDGSNGSYGVGVTISVCTLGPCLVPLSLLNLGSLYGSLSILYLCIGVPSAL